MAVPLGAYVFAESDYLYGVGPLTLRIERVDHAHLVTYNRDLWLQVDGVHFDYRGVEIGNRSALIRRRCLPTAVLPDSPARTAAPARRTR
jgi:hypothetical protein